MAATLKQLLRSKNLTIWQKLVRIPLRLIPPSSRMKVLRGPNKGSKFIAEAVNHSMWIGNFEADKQLYFQNAIKRGDVVWDVGAHIGFYTVLFSKLSGSNGQVVAFEPMSMNVSHLRSHIELNKLNNVKIVQAAAWSAEQLISFSEGNHSSSTGKVEKLSAYQIPSITLDNFWLKNDKKAPKLIKIDVEGAEEQVLIGAEKMLAAVRPVIALALHGENAALTCSKILSKVNYNLYDYKSHLIEGTPKTSEVIAIPKAV